MAVMPVVNPTENETPVTAQMKPLPNYTPGTAQMKPLPNYVPGTAQMSPNPNVTPGGPLQSTPTGPSPVELVRQIQGPGTPAQLNNPPIPPAIKQAAQKAPAPPPTVYEGPHVAPISDVASKLGAQYNYNPATNVHTVNGTPVKPTSVVNGVAHAPVQQIAHAAQVPAPAVKTTPKKVTVTFKPGQTVSGYKGAFSQYAYNPHYGQEAIFRQNAANGYYNNVYDSHGHLIASYFHANPAPPPPPIAQVGATVPGYKGTFSQYASNPHYGQEAIFRQNAANGYYNNVYDSHGHLIASYFHQNPPPPIARVGATVPGYQGTFLQSSYNPKFGQEEIFKQQAQNGYYTNVYDKNGKLLASYYHGNPQGGHEGTLMGFGQQVGAAPGNAVYQEKVNGGYYNNVYNPQGKLVATYYHANPPADTSSQPQGFQFDPTLDAMQQFQYLNPEYQQMMQQEDQKINDMMNKRGLYNSGIAQQDVDTQDQAIEQKEWDAINKQVASDRAEAFKEYNDQLTQQLNWQKAFMPYTMGPTPAQMLPYMYPTANTMVPYIYGPTPYQQQTLSLDQMKALLPYEAMTQYQQAQIGLGQQKLSAQEQQWKAQDVLRQEEIMGYDAQGNPTLARQKFNEQVNMDNAKIQDMITKAQNSAYNDQAKNLATEIKSIDSQINAVLGNSNMSQAQRQSTLQDLYAKRDNLFNQLDLINASLGGSSDSYGGGSAGHPLATPN
jgi:hypothetical protein